MKKLIYYLAALLILGIPYCHGDGLTLPIKQNDTRKKLLIVCDIFEQDIGGVESVVKQIKTRMESRNYNVKLLGLADVSLFSVPFSDGLKLAHPYRVRSEIAEAVTQFKPDHILVVLRGLMSQFAGSYCASNNIPFTAFYSGRAPECLKVMTKIPMWITRFFINSFLSNAANVLVPSFSMRDELTAEGFNNITAWTHGIDLHTFTMPTIQQKKLAVKACGLEKLPRPFYLYVGRISAEKNIPAFLQAKLAGTKIIVGPEDFGLKLETLRKENPEVIFPGPQKGDALLNYYRAADVFLFPSQMDSFGLVMLEALSLGLPIVGFNTNGPRDVVPEGCGVSYLTNDLENLTGLEACAAQAWEDIQNGKITPEQCRTYAAKFSWDSAMDVLENALIVIPKGTYLVTSGQSNLNSYTGFLF